MNTYSSDIIAQTVNILQQRDVRRDKVMLHKFLFFIEFMGTPSGMRFEPYTYGPFSFDLANNLDLMCLLGLLDKDGSNYKVPEPQPHIETGLARKIDQYLDRFIDCLGSLTFGALECVGTLLYCHLALKKSGAQLNDDAILDEFKKWKGAKYPDETVENYLVRLHNAEVI